MKITALFALSIVLSLAITSAESNNEPHKDYSDAFAQFFDDWEDIGVTDLIEVVNEGVKNGLKFSEAVDRTGTKLYCPEEYENQCISDGVEKTLVLYEWEEGCRGYTKDCCHERRIDCRGVMSAGEAAAQSNITLLDMRSSCIKDGCIPDAGCTTDTECASYFSCPSGPTWQTVMRCDTDSRACYCASACPDAYCDYKEMMSASCPDDCTAAGQDTDLDGISDLDEQTIYGTNPNEPDTDGDGLTDWQEIMIGTDPADPDTDNGGQCDGPKGNGCRPGPDPCPLDSSNLCYERLSPGDSIWTADSDNDGAKNAVDFCPQDPWDRCDTGNDPDIDSNADSLPDSWSLRNGIESPLGDPDNDGLNNREEYQAGTDPLNFDSDSDGMPDGWEFSNRANDSNADNDGDGLTNLIEYYLGTDPNNADTDNDGIIDGQEGFVPGENTTIVLELLDIMPRDSSPNDGIFTFKYGQTLSQIIIRAKYSNGEAIMRPIVIGELITKHGTGKAPADFRNTTPINFFASPNYDILEKNEESPFLTLNVKVLDYFGNFGELSTKLFVVNTNEGQFRIEVNKPRGSYAFGQTIPFDIRVAGEAKMDAVSAEVFVEGSGNGFKLIGDISSFIGEYLASSEDPDPLYFLIYANGTLSGETYESIRRAEIDLNPTLTITYLREHSAQNSYAFGVAYPNGDLVKEKHLNGTINGLLVLLSKKGDYFSLTLDENAFQNLRGQDLFIEVSDSNGNKGTLAVPSNIITVSFDTSPLLFTLVIAILLVAALLLLYKKIKARRDREISKVQRKDALGKRKKQLETMIKDTKEQYYKKKISEDYASRKIADLEEELKLLNEDQKALDDSLTKPVRSGGKKKGLS